MKAEILACCCCYLVKTISIFRVDSCIKLVIAATSAPLSLPIITISTQSADVSAALTIAAFNSGQAWAATDHEPCELAYCKLSTKLALRTDHGTS